MSTGSCYHVCLSRRSQLTVFVTRCHLEFMVWRLNSSLKPCFTLINNFSLSSLAWPMADPSSSAPRVRPHDRKWRAPIWRRRGQVARFVPGPGQGGSRFLCAIIGHILIVAATAATTTTTNFPLRQSGPLEGAWRPAFKWPESAKQPRDVYAFSSTTIPSRMNVTSPLGSKPLKWLRTRPARH